MSEAFPVWVIVIDYVLGVVMWTLIGRFGMGIFLPENSNFFFMRAFVRTTDPVIKVFAPITPSFLVRPLVPLYVAWFFFMVRFYVMPLLLGFLKLMWPCFRPQKSNRIPHHSRTQSIRF